MGINKGSVKGLAQGKLGKEQEHYPKDSSVRKPGPSPTGSVNKGNLPGGSLGMEQPKPEKGSATHKG